MPDRRKSFLPNLLSIIRIIISPLIFLAVKSGVTFTILALALAAVLSDFLDGYLARRLNSISEAGKILDPLADKLCIAAAALSAAIYGDLPVLLLMIIIGRDAVISAVGLTIIKRKRKIPVSNFWGKITVSVLAAVLIIYILKIAPLYSIAFYLAIIFAVASLTSYFFVGLKYIGNKS